MKRAFGEKYTNDTYTIHHFEGSWIARRRKKIRRLQKKNMYYLNKKFIYQFEDF